MKQTNGLKTNNLTLKQQIQLPTSDKPIKIAYFILVHRFPKQFQRLFKAIYDPENQYLIHIDKSADDFIHQEVDAFLLDYPNAHILDSENVVWGGYSMVQAELCGMQYLLSIKANWDYFINLSGQDFPLKSQKFIQNFLNTNKGNNFLKVANQATTRPETMNRVDNYFVETSTGFSGVPYKREYLKNVIPYIGGQWMILTRDCCEFICNSAEVEKFEDYYLHTLIPDESFFQTVLMNTKFAGNLVNEDKRAIIWIPDGDIKLRPKTFTMNDVKFLTTGDNLFARKFDETIDSDIIDFLESTFDIYKSISTENTLKLSAGVGV